MAHYTQKAKELKAQFGENAKYVVCEIVDALKITTGHLTISRLLERQELQDDFNYWSDVKKEIEKKDSIISVSICMEDNCMNPATKDYNGHGHFVCDRHYEKLNNEFDEEYD